jgi:hypothetical protein
MGGACSGSRLPSLRYCSWKLFRSQQPAGLQHAGRFGHRTPPCFHLAKVIQGSQHQYDIERAGAKPPRRVADSPAMPAMNWPSPAAASTCRADTSTGRSRQPFRQIFRIDPASHADLGDLGICRRQPLQTLLICHPGRISRAPPSVGPDARAPSAMRPGGGSWIPRRESRRAAAGVASRFRRA